MVKSNGNIGPADYESKFAEFIRMCDEAKKSGAEVVLVQRPSVLGDNYAELIESLSRLARAGLQLGIAQPE